MMQQKALISLILILQVFSQDIFTTCPGPEEVKFGSDAQQWNYGNIDSWKDITNAASCGGQNQSPINIITNPALTTKDVLEIDFLNITNMTVAKPTNTLQSSFNGTQLLVKDLDGNKAGVYVAKQFHIHIPSEHQIDGVQQDMEIHFVHSAEKSYCSLLNNTLSVYSLLFKVDAALPQDEFFTTWFNSATNSTINNFQIYSHFLSKIPQSNTNMYAYSGSLTTPPCSEIVNWFVSKAILGINQVDLNTLTAYWTSQSQFPGLKNNRPIQNLNGRVITEIETKANVVEKVTFINNVLLSSDQILYDDTQNCKLIMISWLLMSAFLISIQ